MVALERPTFSVGDNAERLQRFHREARSVASFHHPNFCCLDLVDEGRGTPRELIVFWQDEARHLLGLADPFLARDHADLAESLIRTRAKSNVAPRLKEWLKVRASTRVDRAEVLALAEVLAWARPSVPGYKEVKELARGSKSWEAMRKKLLARLANEGQHAL